MKTSAPDDVTRYKYRKKLSSLPTWNQTPSLERGPRSYSQTRDKSFQPQPDVYTHQQDKPNCKHLKMVRHQNITHSLWPSLTLSTASGQLKTAYQLGFTKHQIPWETLILNFILHSNRLQNYSNYIQERISLIYPPRFFIVFAHKDVIHPASISFDFVLVVNFKTHFSTTWYLNSWSLSPGSSFSKIFFCFCKLFWWLILRLYMQPTCEYKDLSPWKCMHSIPTPSSGCTVMFSSVTLNKFWFQWRPHCTKNFQPSPL